VYNPTREKKYATHRITSDDDIYFIKTKFPLIESSKLQKHMQFLALGELGFTKEFTVLLEALFALFSLRVLV